MNPRLPDQKLLELLGETFGMQDFDRAVRLATLVMDTANIEGDCVEFGCYRGHTAALIAALMAPGKKLWVYDSFQGLPKPEEGEVNDHQSFFEGSMRCSPEELKDHFRKYGLEYPIIVEGWFKDIKPEQLPDKIAFAHIDCDLKQSAESVLHILYERKSPGAIIVIDDYNHPGINGIDEIVNELDSFRGNFIHPRGVQGVPSIHCYL